MKAASTRSLSEWRNPRRLSLRTTLAALLLLTQPFYIACVWPSLPAIIPNHYDAHGMPHRFGPRAILWILFAGGALVFTLLATIEHFPNAFNLPAQPGQPNRPALEAIAIDMLRWLQLETAFLFSWNIWSIVFVAHHQHEPLGPGFFLVPIAIILLTVFLTFRRMYHAS